MMLNLTALGEREGVLIDSFRPLLSMGRALVKGALA